ncbi:hotdog fold thioesterase [Rhodocytophaga rosea]|uniref:Hotdog fold thioesterase n=1 Tax=Rhodocytophaga rosea TaxID=2704465 RepID=A0A6C0GGA6_9BACT|nr:hotdog fold thioesterase [Rhodocytophaga rosea]QHT67028.1 hotdog fold thioesterase [Rhodocytophaga rosea]
MIQPGTTLEQLQNIGKNTLSEHLGMEFTEIGTDYLCGKMPVDNRTKQPFGLLHGGASVALAETLGSLAAHLSVDTSKQFCVGLEINANHIKGVSSGFVHGKATAIHLGRQTHVWEIRITNDAGQLVCISRITMAVLDKKQA